MVLRKRINMILTPQEASIMVGRPNQKIIQELQKAITLKQTKPLEGGNGLVHALLEGESVPQFTLPMRVRDVHGNVVMCIDLRRSRREYSLNTLGDKYNPLPLTDAKFLTDFAILIQAWCTNVNEFASVYSTGCRVYASWIGFEISKRLALQPQQQNEMIIYFAYFWLTRNFNTRALHQNDYTFIVNSIARYFGFRMDEVQNTLAGFQLEVPAHLDDFCKKIQSINENPKLRDLSAALVMTMLFGSWMSSLNPRELVAVAIEYPPLFMMMMYRGLNERSFKKAKIADLTLRLLDVNNQKSFSLTLSHILNTYSNGASYLV